MEFLDRPSTKRQPDGVDGVNIDNLKPGSRIAIVSGSFRPGFSYQENIWAERLVAHGYAVMVFCPADALHSDRSLKYETLGIKTQGIPNRNLYFESTVGRAVKAYAPALILWFGPPQRFGASLLKTGLPAPLVVFMGQNRRMQAFDWRSHGLSWGKRAKALAYALFRGTVIKRAMKAAQLVIANTEETPEILSLFVPARDWPAIEQKICRVPLGYDPTHFRYRSELREQAREDLGLVNDEVLVVLSSRFAPEKKSSIALCWAGFVKAELGPKVKLLVTGLSENDDSQAFRQMVDASEHKTQVILESFAGRERLSELFHAADIALFARPSISCQEALGTGAFGLFSDDGSMDWLLAEPISGSTFTTGSVEALARALEVQANREAIETQRSETRAARAAAAEFLNYDRLISQVLTVVYSSGT